MDNKLKIKETLKKKLRQEMSMTGTGASVTPGTGEGVATKYAFGKSTGGGTPKDWKAAPSIPNRPSKAMDYKKIFEGELKLGVKYDYKGDSGFISTGGSNDLKNWNFLGDKGKYPYLAVKADLVPSKEQPGKYDGAFDLGMGKGYHIDEIDANDTVLMKVRAAAYQKSQPKSEPVKTINPDYKAIKNADKIKVLLRQRNQLMMDMEQEAESEGGPIADRYGGMLNKIDRAIAMLKGQGENNPYMSKADIEKIAAMMNEAMHIGTDTKTDSDIYFEPSTGTFSINVIDAAGNRNNKLQVNTIDDVLAKFPNWKWTEQGKAEFNDALNEGYAQFRNNTKTRTKPEQFHQAVKEVKKKVNEINRLFEYMDRLKSELNEGEELKYKKYTEKSIQQIKESTKQLFFKSTKLK